MAQKHQTEPKSIITINHLRKEEMKSTPKGSVSVGATVVIESLEISDAQVVATVKAAQAENRDLVDFITTSVVVGVNAIQATGVSLGIESLAGCIADTEKTISKISKDLGVNLGEKLEAITGEQGSFTQALALQLAAMSKDLEKMTGGEDSPIRKGLQKQLEEISKSLTDNFTRATVHQKDEIAKMLDSENAQSPLRLMSQNISKLGESVAEIQKSMSETKGRSIEAGRGTSKGHDYESKVVAAVSEVAGSFGDEPLATGGTPGRGKSKMGDAVIYLREGLSVKAKLVVEAKDMSSKKTDSARRKYWMEQAEGAREARGAIGFLGLCKNLEDMPGGNRISVLDKLGQNLVLAYDPDIDSPDLLFLVYQVVKMHSLSIIGSGAEINPVAINGYIEESLSMLDRFTQVDDSVQVIKKEATNISSLGESIKDALTGHLRAMRREVAGNVEQVMLENDAVLEITALEDDFIEIEELGINLNRPDQVA
jgi:hypothetical protein